MSRSLYLLFMLLLACASLKAQRFSYVYLQGDKQTPFYVKLNGEMQPRYGKNYCILPQLDAGTIKLEILFQQNVYPAQQFTIRIPESGSRAFMITRRDQQCSLYDLQQHFYLQAGNAEGDDHLPTVSPTPPIAQQASQEPDAAEPEPQAAQIPAATNKRPVPEPTTEQVTYRRPRRKKEPVQQPAALESSPADNQPRFLDNVKLSNEHEQAPGEQAATTIGQADTAFTQKKPLDITFRNSDCPQPLPDADFERIYKAMMQKQADEDRVDYLNGQLDKCYQSWQARTLGSMLTEDAARFTFLKNIYPHITDQQAFPLLDDMLRSDVWKAQFTQLTHR